MKYEFDFLCSNLELEKKGFILDFLLMIIINKGKMDSDLFLLYMG